LRRRGAPPEVAHDCWPVAAPPTSHPPAAPSRPLPVPRHPQANRLSSSSTPHAPGLHSTYSLTPSTPPLPLPSSSPSQPRPHQPRGGQIQHVKCLVAVALSEVRICSRQDPCRHKFLCLVFLLLPCAWLCYHCGRAVLMLVVSSQILLYSTHFMISG
jgi:hypothetical protein